jgi:hypothetical protein
MKKAIVILLTTLAFNVDAQYHEAKIDLGGLLIGNIGAAYEYGINDDMGVNVRLAYFNSSNLFTGDDVLEYSAFTLTTDFRYYLDSDEGADGYFFSAYLKYRGSSSEDYWVWPNLDGNGNPTGTNFSEDLDATSMGMGLTFGNKWISDYGILFETYFGVGRYLITTNNEAPKGYEEYRNSQFLGLEDLDFDVPWDIRLGFIVGYRF